MTKMILFGATGGTGHQTLLQALGNGYAVTVVVRDPARVGMEHPQLTIIKGDVLQPHTFEKSFEDAAVIVSCLGTGRSRKVTTIYSEGMRHILTAMRNAHVTRLICISAGALEVHHGMNPVLQMVTRHVLQRLLRPVYSDMALMEAEVTQSNLDWTIIRPPMLKNKSMTGRYRIALGQHLKSPFSIGRADLAHFIVHHVEDTKIFNTTVEIAY